MVDNFYSDNQIEVKVLERKCNFIISESDLIYDKDIISVQETITLLNSHYKECVTFWNREGKTRIESLEYAINDIRQIKTNPYSPDGDYLNKYAWLSFLEMKKIELNDLHEEL